MLLDWLQACAGTVRYNKPRISSTLWEVRQTKLSESSTMKILRGKCIRRSEEDKSGVIVIYSISLEYRVISAISFTDEQHASLPVHWPRLQCHLLARFGT